MGPANLHLSLELDTKPDLPLSTGEYLRYGAERGIHNVRLSLNGSGVGGVKQVEKLEEDL